MLSVILQPVAIVETGYYRYDVDNGGMVLGMWTQFEVILESRNIYGIITTEVVVYRYFLPSYFAIDDVWDKHRHIYYSLCLFTHNVTEGYHAVFEEALVW